MVEEMIKRVPTLTLIICLEYELVEVRLNSTS